MLRIFKGTFAGESSWCSHSWSICRAAYDFRVPGAVSKVVMFSSYPGFITSTDDYHLTDRWALRCGCGGGARDTA